MIVLRFSLFCKAVEDGDRRFDRLLDGCLAIFCDFVRIFRAVVDAGWAANAAAWTAHAFDEIVLEFAKLMRAQRFVTLGKAVADDRIGGEFFRRDIVLLQRLRDSLGKTADTGEDAAEIAGVVEHRSFEGGDVDVFGIEQRLQFFEGEDRIHMLAHQSQLIFLGDAWPDEDGFAARIHFLEHFTELGHWAVIVADLRHDVRIIFVDVVHKSRAAGAGEESFFDQFLRFQIRHHVCAPGCFQHSVEPELADTADCLLCGHIFQRVVLAGDGWRHNGVNVVLRVVFTFADETDHICDKAFVDDGTERTLVHTLPAADAFFFVDQRAAAHRITGERFGLAGLDAWARAFDDGAVRTAFGAHAAVDAFCVIDRGAVVRADRDRVLWAIVHAAMGQATTAVVRHRHPVQREFVAGDRNDVDDGLLFRRAAAGQLHIFVADRSLLVDAAAHRRLAVIREERFAHAHHAERIQLAGESQSGNS